MQCAVEERAGRGPRAGEERRLSAVVVGELWVRSRLPKGVLAQYWSVGFYHHDMTVPIL